MSGRAGRQSPWRKGRAGPVRRPMHRTTAVDAASLCIWHRRSSSARSGTHRCAGSLVRRVVQGTPRGVRRCADGPDVHTSCGGRCPGRSAGRMRPGGPSAPGRPARAFRRGSAGEGVRAAGRVDRFGTRPVGRWVGPADRAGRSGRPNGPDGQSGRTAGRAGRSVAQDGRSRRTVGRSGRWDGRGGRPRMEPVRSSGTWLLFDLAWTATRFRSTGQTQVGGHLGVVGPASGHRPSPPRRVDGARGDKGTREPSPDSITTAHAHRPSLRARSTERARDARPRGPPRPLGRGGRTTDRPEPVRASS